MENNTNFHLDEIKNLNKELDSIIKKKCSLAHEYFKKEYPMLRYGNIIFDGFGYRQLEPMDIVFDDYYYRRSLRYKRDYKYDDERPKNQIEKEFDCSCKTIDLIKSGYSKKRNWLGINSKYLSDRYELVCHIDDFEKLAKQYGIKPKLNSTTVEQLHKVLKNQK